MPELPEVETIRLGLQKYLPGHQITAIEVRLPKLFTGKTEQIIGAKFTHIRRRGKGLILDLDNEYSLAAHVKMTGQFIYEESKESSSSEDRQETKETKVEGEVSRVSQGKNKVTKSFHPKLSLPVNLPNKYTHVIFQLDTATLFYNDIRQFGWLQIVPTEKVLELPFFKALGAEPFVDLTPERFAQLARSGKLPIKQLLMDQQRIAGVGNIYANDALWLAQIDPRRTASSLSEEERVKLYESLLFVLQEGLKYQGASETNFFHVDGSKGDYQNHFLVYGKTGESCTRCGTMIERIVLGGRGTFICPTCQR